MSNSFIKQIDECIMYLLPIIFILLIFYFYAVFINDISYVNTRLLEFVIIVYFVFELVIKYLLVDSTRDFITKHWLKIILILPFLRIFRVFGVFGNFARNLRYLPYLQKLAKTPKLIKTTKFTILVVLFKLSVIEDKEKIKKEKSKIKKD